MTSAAFLGMDVEGVERTATRFRTAARRIELLEREVDAIVGQLRGRWVGPGAQRFFDAWQSTYRPTCRRLGDDVERLASKLDAQAFDQTVTSATNNGTEAWAYRFTHVADWAGFGDVWDAFSDGWDGVSFVTNVLGVVLPIAGIVENLAPLGGSTWRYAGWVYDVTESVLHVAEIGRVLPVIGIGMDTISAVDHLFDDGRFNANGIDNALFDGTAAVLGGAALVASGSVVGLPAGVVLGGLAVGVSFAGVAYDRWNKNHSVKDFGAYKTVSRRAKAARRTADAAWNGGKKRAAAAADAAWPFD